MANNPLPEGDTLRLTSFMTFSVVRPNLLDLAKRSSGPPLLPVVLHPLPNHSSFNYLINFLEEHESGLSFPPILTGLSCHHSCEDLDPVST